MCAGEISYATVISSPRAVAVSTIMRAAMRVQRKQTIDETRSAHWQRIATALLIGTTTASILVEGAFHTVDAVAAGGASFALVLSQLRFKLDKKVGQATIAISALTLWWLISGIFHNTPRAFFPLGASMIGFLAAFLVIGRLGAADRETSSRIIVAFGAGTAALGLVALAIRWSPLAIQSASTWRLSSTLTYFNAAGLLIAMATLMSLSLNHNLKASRVAVYLCVTGLIATQSRAALLAVLVGSFFVPLAQVRKSVPSLAFGIAAGAAVVIVNQSGMHLLLLLPVIAGVVGAATTERVEFDIWQTLRTHRLMTGIVLASTVAAGGLLVHPFLARLNSPDNRDRVAIWASSIDQWRSSPVTGVGPDRLLDVRYIPADGIVAVFAHNEYLQVLADGGLIGAALLGASIVAIARCLRRETVAASCAIGALMAFALAGAFDFDWHLPALGLLAGWIAGLAERTKT